jgi:hypothetical protein
VDELVDLVFSVTPDTTVVVRVSLFSESFLGGVELEGPQEVVGFFEVGSNGGDFVDKVFNVSNTVLSELSLNNAVVSERNSAFADLTIASLVDEISDGLLGGISISNVWFNSSDHIDGGLVESYEGSVVELSQSEELQDLFAGGVELVDTTQ